MTDRGELTTDLEAIADMPRTALELYAYGMKVERDAPQAVVDTDIAADDAWYAHQAAMDNPDADVVGAAELASRRALVAHDEALGRYRKEH